MEKINYNIFKYLQTKEVLGLSKLIMLSMFALIATLTHANVFNVTYDADVSGSFPVVGGTSSTKVYGGLSTGDAITTAPILVPNQGFVFSSWSLTAGTEAANNTVGTTDLTYTAIYTAATTYNLTVYENEGLYSRMSNDFFQVIPYVSVSAGAGAGTGYLKITIIEPDANGFDSKLLDFDCSDAPNTVKVGNVMTISNVDLNAGSQYLPNITLQMKSSLDKSGTPPDYRLNVEVELFNSSDVSLATKTIILTNEVKLLKTEFFIQDNDGNWSNKNTNVINMGREGSTDHLPLTSTATANFFVRYFDEYAPGGNIQGGFTPISAPYIEVTLPEWALFDPAVNQTLYGSWERVSGGVETPVGSGSYKSEAANLLIVKYTNLLLVDGLLNTSSSAANTKKTPLKLSFPGAPMNTSGTTTDYVLKTIEKGQYQNAAGVVSIVSKEDNMIFQIASNEVSGFSSYDKVVFRPGNSSLKVETIIDSKEAKENSDFFYKVSLNNTSVENESIHRFEIVDSLHVRTDHKMSYDQIAIYTLSGDMSGTVTIEYYFNGSWTSVANSISVETRENEGAGFETKLTWTDIPASAEKIRVVADANTTLPAGTKFYFLIDCKLTDSDMETGALSAGDTIKFTNEANITAYWVDGDTDDANDVSAISNPYSEATINVINYKIVPSFKDGSTSYQIRDDANTEFNMRLYFTPGEIKNLKMHVRLPYGAKFDKESLNLEYAMSGYSVSSDPDKLTSNIEDLQYQIFEDWKGIKGDHLVIYLGNVESTTLKGGEDFLTLNYEAYGVPFVGESDEVIKYYATYDDVAGVIAVDDTRYIFSDIDDFHDNGSYIDDNFLTRERDIDRIQTYKLSASIEKKGDLDESFSTVTKAISGGSVTSQLKIINNLSVVGGASFIDFKAINVLPSIGDKYIVTDDERNSKYRPLLTGPVSITVTSADPNLQSTDFTIEYSTLVPSSSAVLSTFVDNESNWTDSPTDWETVKSIRITANSGVLISPQTVVVCEYIMNVPDDYEYVGENAINTFAYSTEGNSYLQVNDAIAQIVLPGISGIAFEDNNSDGIYDASVDDVLPGVVAKLQKQQIDDSWSTASASDLKSGLEQDLDVIVASDGAYKFDIVEAGNYRVTFSTVTDYELAKYVDTDNKGSKVKDLAGDYISDEVLILNMTEIYYIYAGYATTIFNVYYHMFTDEFIKSTDYSKVVHSDIETTCPKDNENYYEGNETTILSEGSMTVTGYTFLKWQSYTPNSDNSETGSNEYFYENDRVTMPANDLHFVAIWTNGGGGTLPVELLDFTADCNLSYISIDWRTASEINNDYFTLERSFDGEKWDKVAEITGAGNSNSIKEYHTEDVYYSNVYYRLTQTDFDGKNETFDIISVNDCNDNNNLDVILYPTMCSDVLNMEFSEQITECKLEIINSNGIVIKEFNYYEVSDVKINTTDLISGYYYTRLIFRDSIITKPFIKK